MVKHVWFDLSDTLAVLRPDGAALHQQLLHETYAAAVDRTLDDDLIEEFQAQRAKHHSNSGLFHALGHPTTFWADRVATLDARQLYQPRPHVNVALQRIKTVVPISLFTNIRPDRILAAIGIERWWFTHILDATTIAHPKPALDGFREMVRLSQLPPTEIMYVGDSVEKDIRPAKSVGLVTCIVGSRSPEADYSFTSVADIDTLFSFIPNDH